MTCKHEAFRSEVGIARLTDVEGGPVTGYSADVRIYCSQCGLPFQWLGLPPGSHPARPMVSVDGLEARMPIAPQGTAANPLDIIGAAIGSKQ